MFLKALSYYAYTKGATLGGLHKDQLTSMHEV